jgi:hypothetical protein
LFLNNEDFGTLGPNSVRRLPSDTRDSR